MRDAAITDNPVAACKVSEHAGGEEMSLIYAGRCLFSVVSRQRIKLPLVSLANIASWRKVARLAINARRAGKSGEAHNAHRYLAH